ncbi:hypothetical protein DPEC_G00277850 [Dallia pectoralis]|uniref:Uncharacterized protein n=1 Tax=Dallia pectoralis TaxID=75939 RepID=A0ACC2FM36_DALPE|nr:hypothetical protein DPEC_G00277850 [Dallia pectoralis]
MVLEPRRPCQNHPPPIKREAARAIGDRGRLGIADNASILSSLNVGASQNCRLSGPLTAVSSAPRVIAHYEPVRQLPTHTTVMLFFRSPTLSPCRPISLGFPRPAQWVQCNAVPITLTHIKLRQRVSSSWCAAKCGSIFSLAHLACSSGFLCSPRASAPVCPRFLDSLSKRLQRAPAFPR